MYYSIETETFSYVECLCFLCSKNNAKKQTKISFRVYIDVEGEEKTAGGETMERDLLNQCIEQYGPGVLALSWSFCRSRADAEDLYQETWTKAMRYFDRYQPEKPFDKWIATICINTYKNTFRAFQRSRQMQFGSNEEKNCFLDSLNTTGKEDRDTLIVLRQAVEALAV